MPVPFKQRYFEDYTVGETAEFGDHLVTEQEIVEFALRYDPQTFHTDAVAARTSSFGELVASGWMTAAVTMRIVVDHFISEVSSMGSPGVDELRWPRPVRVGDRLRVRVHVADARRSRSKPDRGLVQIEQSVLNQRDEVVMTLRGWGMYRCRDANSPVT